MNEFPSAPSDPQAFTDWSKLKPAPTIEELGQPKADIRESSDAIETQNGPEVSDILDSPETEPTHSRNELLIDSESIRHLLDDNPTIFPKEENIFQFTGVDEKYSEKLADLEATLDAIARLPERLDFEPGITLIIGPNGGGKSTLAKAMHLAIEVKNQLKINPDLSFDQAMNNIIRQNLAQNYQPDFGGLAPFICKYIEVNTSKEPVAYQYMDATVLAGARLMPIAHGDKPIENEMKISANYGSNRQYLEDNIFDYFRSLVKPDSEDFLFLDEPEVGLDPKRHQNLLAQLVDNLPKNASTIIPTNSPILYMSDLPRIDLEHPEWGIFRPSEHPGYFE